MAGTLAPVKWPVGHKRLLTIINRLQVVTFACGYVCDVAQGDFMRRDSVMAVIKGFTDPEDELYDTTSREVASVRRAPDSESEIVANNLEAMLRRVGGSSMHEIDRLVGELEILRERLETEGERVQREIVEYAHLSQSSMQSTKIIAESLAKFMSVADDRRA